VQKFILQPAVSAASDILTPAPLFLGDEKYFDIQAVFTGVDVVGTFKLQQSVDGTNFVDLSGKSTSVTGSATAIQGDNVAQYPWVRFVWDYTSGTGNITVTAIIKQNQVYD
jgi:hypothetical protein